MDRLAAAVFHKDPSVEEDFDKRPPIKIFFVPKHKGPIHTFSHFSEQCAERLLLYIQDLGCCAVVYTELQGRAIDPEELNPLRQLTEDDIDSLWKREEPTNPAQHCCVAIGMQIEDQEPEGDGTIHSDDEDDEEEDSNP